MGRGAIKMRVVVAGGRGGQADDLRAGACMAPAILVPANPIRLDFGLGPLPIVERSGRGGRAAVEIGRAHV